VTAVQNSDKTRARHNRAVPLPLLHALSITLLITFGALGLARGAYAQEPASGQASAATASGATATQNADDDDDTVINPAEPDFVLVNLPTTARLAVGKGNFRISHRFAGNLANNSFKQNLESLFGIDQGAIIGFEYRIGVMKGLQAVAFRTNFDRTVQFHAKYDAVRQRGSNPVAVSGILSIEGTNNFQEKYAPAIGLVVSRTIANRVALYASPIWVNNTAASLNPTHDHGGGEATEAEAEHIHMSTTYVGFGTRLRVLNRTYLVGEVAPRLDGYAPNKLAYGFSVEKRAGGHVFSLTFTNSFALTYAQLARGGPANTLYMGFNIGRKFF
jgi:hypothetical protein